MWYDDYYDYWDDDEDIFLIGMKTIFNWHEDYFLVSDDRIQNFLTQKEL